MLTRNLFAVVNLLVTHYSLIGDRNHSGSLSSITVQKFHLNIKPFIHGSNAYIITIYDSINDANNAQLIHYNNEIKTLQNMYTQTVSGSSNYWI